VLPAAIDLTIAAAAAPRGDARIRIHSLDFNQCDDFSLSNARRHPMGGWRNYPRGVIWALLDSQLELRGADLSISGDVPQGAGLSSSAALELAVAGALCGVSGLEVAARDLALLCQRAEHMYAGVQCGVMDQLAAALGREGCALCIDCRSLETEAVPIPEGIAIVVIDSKAPRDLAATPYNRRHEECAQAAAALGLESLRDADKARLTALSGDLQRRARHVVTENARVLAAKQALRDGDRETLGRLLAWSHASLRDDFAVSTPELDLLVDLACVAPGVIGARLTGGGFGGCTVNLVEAGETDAFIARVVPEYQRRTGLDAEAYVCRAVDGMRVRDA
jgi:galactokinase